MPCKYSSITSSSTTRPECTLLMLVMLSTVQGGLDKALHWVSSLQTQTSVEKTPQEQKKKGMEELAKVLAELGIEGDDATAASAGSNLSVRSFLQNAGCRSSRIAPRCCVHACHARYCRLCSAVPGGSRMRNCFYASTAALPPCVTHQSRSTLQRRLPSQMAKSRPPPLHVLQSALGRKPRRQLPSRSPRLRLAVLLHQRRPPPTALQTSSQRRRQRSPSSRTLPRCVSDHGQFLPSPRVSLPDAAIMLLA